MGVTHGWRVPATAPRSLVLDPTLHPTAVRVYLALQVADDFSPAGLAAILGVHRSTIRRALDELIAADYLRIEEGVVYGLLDGGGPLT